MEPRFKHDCDTCIYLGQSQGHDLYFCPAHQDLVARFDNDGPDYLSIEVDLFERWVGERPVDNVYHEVYRLAKVKGLL